MTHPQKFLADKLAAYQEGLEFGLDAPRGIALADIKDFFPSVGFYEGACAGLQTRALAELLLKGLTLT